MITVEANMVPGQLLRIELPNLQEQLTSLSLYPRISSAVKGQNDQQDVSTQLLEKALLKLAGAF